MEHSPAFTRLVEEARARVPEISPEEVRRRQVAHEHFHLVDVREDREWEAAHITSAKHLGKGIIERDIETTIPSLDAPIVLYCGGGFRSLLAGETLLRMGYRNVRSMAGGWKRWRELDYPTARGRGAKQPTEPKTSLSGAESVSPATRGGLWPPPAVAPKPEVPLRTPPAGPSFEEAPSSPPREARLVPPLGMGTGQADTVPPLTSSDMPPFWTL